MTASKLAQSIRYSHKATGAVKVGKKYALIVKLIVKYSQFEFPFEPFNAWCPF